MKKLIFVFILLLSFSCNYFENKKIHVSDEHHELVQEKLKKLDKTQVDRYPIFSSCESLESDLSAEKECFIETLRNHITSNIITSDVVLEKPLHEEFNVLVEVDKKGDITIVKTTISDSLQLLFPSINQRIEESLLSLPKIEPAMKQLSSMDKNTKGDEVHVSIQFLIPIKIVAI